MYTHTEISVRVAKALDMLTTLRVQWILEMPTIHPNQVSMAHLDEYIDLMKPPGVEHKIGVQCRFGALSS